ncbi:cell division protein FtsQ/DivIB [Fusobacterium hwasookii]|uniref:Cell division protein FtsQ n=1 Tax=Fusobacterium hwasookii ChDC F206 TaxID=1307443 RepID=A0AAC8WJJ7_9FUSO|nr:cell division protein FtsQ/DivIB [Fusobacterium hwasookii]ALQ35204.1 cell division protein FtsQ [Fusobacterium hwasookii ChDC F206]QNE68553.1 FtsQ-type POTRA domain-containing protein [Fusobacterium hwasookii]
MGIRLLFLSGIIYLIYMLPQNFFRLNYFNINQINITDNSKMLQNELTELSKKIYNKSAIYVDSNKIKEFIEKDVRVESATVEKNSLGEITIDVKEKDLVYYAVIGKNIYLVDKEGRIFAYLNEKEVEGVPIIIANNEEEIKEISDFLNEISDLAIFKRISQMYKVKDKEYIIILADGVKIKTNRIKDSNDEINKEKENKRYVVAEQLYFNMSKERKIDYIDLRFNDYIIKYLGDGK